MFRAAMSIAKGKGTPDQPLALTESSVGAFVRQRLHDFFVEQEYEDKITYGGCEEAEGNTEDHGKMARESETSLRGEIDFSPCLPKSVQGEVYSDAESSVASHVPVKLDTADSKLDSGSWACSPRLLQESAVLSFESLERSISGCNSLEDLDLASFKEYTEFPGPHQTIGKGYASVLKELDNSLPVGTVKLEKKVQKVFWNHSHPSVQAPVVLCCEDGSIIQADHVILTMSLGVLKAGVSTCLKPCSSTICRSVTDLRGWKAPIEEQKHEFFEPSLPSWKLDVITRLGFGVVNKLFLHLDPAADKKLFSEILFLHHNDSHAVPSWLKKAFSMFPIYEGSNVIALWFTGDEALQMEYLSDEEILDGIVQMLISFRLADINEKQVLRSMFKGVLRSQWGTNPLCRGSYSFVAVGSSGRDIDDLAKPLPEASQNAKDNTSILLSDAIESASDSPLQLLFAGEATHRNFYSTTHGAYLSGVREADRLLDYFKNSCGL
ncbi:hypothetical protein KP509_39G014400 [Ceratopteris richardii]|nr:hypothetical protein KP509_39G014400 [Ceratopteris richardii]